MILSAMYGNFGAMPVTVLVTVLDILLTTLDWRTLYTSGAK